MKKRVIIGIACALLGLLVVFWLGPLVNTISQQTVEVIRLRNNIGQGSEITINDLEVVDMNPAAVPAGVVNDVNQIVGKFATTALFAGDYLTNAKMSPTANNADSVLAALDGTKVAISVPISFAGSISGKLENGDIVRFYIKHGGTDEAAYTPKSLMYVRVITATTGGGIDQDERLYNEDGSYEMPSTITVLVSDTQARDLADLVSSASMYLSLICRGESEKAEEFLAIQDALLAENKDDQSATTTPDDTTGGNATTPTQPAGNQG